MELCSFRASFVREFPASWAALALAAAQDLIPPGIHLQPTPYTINSKLRTYTIDPKP